MMIMIFFHRPRLAFSSSSAFSHLINIIIRVLYGFFVSNIFLCFFFSRLLTQYRPQGREASAIKTFLQAYHVQLRNWRGERNDIYIYQTIIFFIIYAPRLCATSALIEGASSKWTFLRAPLRSRCAFQVAAVCDVMIAKMFYTRDHDGVKRKGKIPNDILMRFNGAFFIVDRHQLENKV